MECRVWDPAYQPTPFTKLKLADMYRRVRSSNSICRAFADAGCIVFASARKSSSMSNLPSSIERLELDVTSDESCERAVSDVISKHGRIDILVNNAGAGATGALVDFKIDEMRKVYDTNVFGVARLTQKVVPHMAKRKSGLIINIGSIVGNISTPVSADRLMKRRTLVL